MIPSDPWASASANVTGCALAWRARAIWNGSSPAEVDGQEAIKDLILRSTLVAREAYESVGVLPDDASCTCGRCYEVAILIALSTQWSILSGISKKKIFDDALKELDLYLKGRS
jgi:hypothetical protein